MNKGTIASWLITIQPELKLGVLKDLIEQRKNLLETQPEVLYTEINQEFDGLVKSKIVEEASRCLGLSIQELTEVIEDLNIQEYLK